MNDLMLATVAEAPNDFGWARVHCSGTLRFCWFNPLRFVAPRPVPVASDLVMVGEGTVDLVAVWLIRA